MCLHCNELLLVQFRISVSPPVRLSFSIVCLEVPRALTVGRSVEVYKRLKQETCTADCQTKTERVRGADSHIAGVLCNVELRHDDAWPVADLVKLLNSRCR